MKYVLVLDVAKGKSMFMLSSNDGEVLLEPTEYPHNKSNFEHIDAYINKLDIKDNLTVVMEATSIYHKAPERFFKENNYHVIVFNPLIGKEITNTIRKTKTDKQDCFKLTNLFWKGSIPDRNYTEDEIYTKLNELSRQYYHLDEGLTRHKNRYKELLHLCFPEFELCFKNGKIYELTALNFIKEFPHAYIIKEKRVDALAYNMANTNDRHLNYYKRKANIIKECAQNSYPGVNENSKDVDNLKQLTEIIIDLTKQKDSIKVQMIDLAKHTKNFKCINSLFGIGELSASLIIAELKDITRFNNIKQINASCGLDPTIIQSGKSINYHGPISKRGNRYARKILFNCSRNIVTLSAKCDKENSIYVYYQKKKQEGKHYYACLTACSTKLIRIIYALCMYNSQEQN
ncbi:MAG: IS110 family transposase [Bacilli bacterium]|nr:IS110 family transposase [Bacilli bacterium]